MHRAGLWLRYAAVKIGPALQTPFGPAHGATWYGTTGSTGYELADRAGLTKGVAQMVNAATNVTDTQFRKGNTATHNPLDTKVPIRARP